jgi:hypothetical protein
MALAKKKRTYRYLTQEDQSTRLISFRVPKNFPLKSIEVKILISDIGIALTNESKEIFDRITDYATKWQNKQLKPTAVVDTADVN